MPSQDRLTKPAPSVPGSGSLAWPPTWLEVVGCLWNCSTAACHMNPDQNTNQSLPPNNNTLPPTLTTDKSSSSRWSPKSRLDGHDAPFATEPRTIPTTTNIEHYYHQTTSGLSLCAASCTNTFTTSFLIYIHLWEARSRYQPFPFGSFYNIFGSRRGGQEHEFPRFLFLMYHYNNTSIQGVKLFQHKKERREDAR